jgi:UDP-N-acetylmuramyl tripeptide synthase
MALTALGYDAGANGTLNGLGTLLNSGFIRIYTGTQPALNVAVTGVLLVTMTFGATAFAAASASAGTSSMSANAITSGTAGNTGTAGYFALVKSDGTTVIATGSVGTSGADLNLSSLSISSSANVSCSSFVITMSETWT